MKLLKKIFTSKIVLYLLAIYSLLAVLGFLLKNQIENLTFFLALGYLSSYFSKNMIINFLVAILGTNVWASSVREGFKEGHDSEVGHAHLDEEDEEDDEDDKRGRRRRRKQGPLQPKVEAAASKGGEKEELTNLRPSRLRRGSGNYEEDEDEDNNVARIDSAATMAATYKQMENVLGSGGMKNLARDTRSLVEQQKSLMKQVETMQPMMKQMGGMIQNFGGVDGINQMMKQLKGMGGIQKPAGLGGKLGQSLK